MYIYIFCVVYVYVIAVDVTQKILLLCRFLLMDLLFMTLLQENYLVVMRKNIKHWSGQQRGKYLRALMLYVALVLVLEILGWQTLDSARLIWIWFEHIPIIWDIFTVSFTFLPPFVGAHWRVYSINWTRVSYTSGSWGKTGSYWINNILLSTLHYYDFPIFLIKVFNFRWFLLVTIASLVLSLCVKKQPVLD